MKFRNKFHEQSYLKRERDIRDERIADAVAWAFIAMGIIVFILNEL